MKNLKLSVLNEDGDWVESKPLDIYDLAKLTDLVRALENKIGTRRAANFMIHSFRSVIEGRKNEMPKL